jgi:hypothetical protein
MTSYTTFIIIKLMTFWNYLVNIYNNIIEQTSKFYYHITDYIYGYNDIWLFVSGHTLPLSLSNLYNLIHVNWIYNNYDNTLSLNTNQNSNLIKYKFSWLSAKLIIYKEDSKETDIRMQYEIDNFIEKFSLDTTDKNVPSLHMIFVCWCVYTKHWFSPDDIVEFHIIDNMGEDIILNLNDHNESLCIKKNKICIIIHNNDVINCDDKVSNIVLIEE